MSELDAKETPQERMKALETRLSKLKADAEPKPRVDQGYSNTELAWRMVLELVAGIGIGGGMGFGLDWLFGTTPFLMIIFILLGLAAGVQTMIRSAKEVQMKQQAQEAYDEEGNGRG